jgi:GNAT superfamily N-acetyltransferase
VGVAAWERANNKDTPEGCTALLLHGLYIDPAFRQQGVGSRLFSSFEDAARQQHYTGLLVKAQTDASGFFASRGMKKLPIKDAGRHYANRFWKDIEQ